MCNKKTLRSDIRKCKAICRALKFGDYHMAFSNAKLKSDIWILPIEEVNERLFKNIRYDAENGTNFGCVLARNLCQDLKEQKGE